MAQPTSNHHVVNSDTSNPSSPIVQFNPASQLPLKLTGSVNFATWKAQVSMLMYGHDLFGHLDGSNPAPNQTIGTDNTSNPAFALWFRQDKLIQNALMASVDPTIALVIANATTAHHAWQSLHTTYANKSQSRLFSLRDQMARLTKETQTMTEYLTRVRSLADELAQAGAPLANDELVVHILRGLGTEYREISAAIRARDTTISYEDLYDKLMDHEIFLQHEEMKKPTTAITAAFAHSTKSAPNNNPRQNRRYNNSRGNDRGDQHSGSWQSRRNNSGRHNAGNSEQVKCQLCKKLFQSQQVN